MDNKIYLYVGIAMILGTDSEANLGNFHALLQFRIDAGDKVLEEHFKTAGKNCTYHSKTIQNELIEVCGDYIRNRLLEEIREAQFFGISADEVADLTESRCPWWSDL